MKKNQLYKAIQKKWEKKNREHNFLKKKDLEVKLHQPTFGVDEITAFTEQMITTNVTMGKEVENFENNYSNYLKTKYSVSSNSGSSANLLMIAALCNHYNKDKLNFGDEVIIPALTWSTTMFPLTQYGLKPVFVDCDLKTLNIDLNKIEGAIGPKTRAIFIVHIYGNPCDMSGIISICKKYNLLLIEDSCESMGAYFNKSPVGSFGLMSSFSFYFSHHITCMEGGITVTKDKSLFESMKMIRSHGWIRNIKNKAKWKKMGPNIDPKFLFVNEGYNLRLTEPQAVMASIQLKKLDLFVKKRRKAATYYKKRFKEFEDNFFYQNETRNAYHSWFGFPITIKNRKIKCKILCDYLNRNGIETRAVVSGNLAKQPVTKLYPNRVSGKLENVNYIMNNSFSIGCHQDITYNEIDYVYMKIKRFLKKTL
ncbi:aminotransferase class I/II-fold pyridoxal phosphate-dependent enzyme [Rickettsiales bacterium]|nr:aminotransferase class I/II-fold pyridoxal phosphate-dependent enzyme [Rickettsiales bacterium]